MRPRVRAHPQHGLELPRGFRHLALVQQHQPKLASRFEVVGLQGISTAAEAGARDVDELATFIASRRIPAIFVESSVAPRTIEAVREAVRARGFDVEIGGALYADAMGSAGTPEGTYVGMVRHNVRTIVSALGGQAP